VPLLTPRFWSSNNWEEAETRVVHLDEDDADGIDTMLVYIYTFETPNFYDKKQVGSHQFDAAEKCYLLGDKYDLPDFRDSGCQYILESIQDSLPAWKSRPIQTKLNWISFIRRLWSWEIEGSIGLRDALTTQLALIVHDVVKNESFLKLLRENEEFNLAFICALATPAKK